MIKLFSSVCIEAPVDAVWARLAALEDIQIWSEPVLSARCEGPIVRGIGAERVCELAGNMSIREHWIAWEEGKSFQYEGFGIPMVKRATNRWSVQAEGDKTLLTSEATVVLKGGIFGKLLEPIMAPIMRSMGPKAFAGFKYLVENGKPYQGPLAELPIPLAVC